MPPKRGSKKKATKAAAPPVEEVKEVDSALTNEAQPPSENETEGKVDSDTSKGVSETPTQESVEETTMAGIEETSQILGESGDGQDEDEDMEKQGEAKKVTMEERKAKFDELRKKMVCFFFFFLSFFHRGVDGHFLRLHRPKRTAHLS